MIISVIAFMCLSGKKNLTNQTSFSINTKENIGLVLNIYILGENKKLVFKHATETPVSFKALKSIIPPDKLLKML